MDRNAVIEARVKWYLRHIIYGDDNGLGGLSKHGESFEIHGIAARFEMVDGIEKAFVQIHTGRPGLLIGKAGRTLNEVVNKLEGFLKTPIQLNLIELDPFKVDYNLLNEEDAGF